MHSDCIRYVNAHAQASFAEELQEALSDAERDVIRRGRNAHARHPAPRNQNPEDYSAATGFEALIGYLYLTGQEERLREIMGRIIHG
jgi:ribonuclease-3 family protein